MKTHDWHRPDARRVMRESRESRLPWTKIVLVLAVLLALAGMCA